MDGFQTMRIGCVDVVSNTLFPATAAEELESSRLGL
jgi:hypothetical protein